MSENQPEQEPKPTWYVVDKDAYDKLNDIIIGPFSTAHDAGVAREYIERRDARNRTFWIVQRVR